MKDVSYAAGVSVATVSHVLNDTKFVTDSMRKKVLDAVEALNYKPNIGARNFKMGKRQTIGFVAPDISNVYFSALINQVEAIVSKQNYMLLVVNTQENPEKELKQIRRLSSGLVDGLIVASSFTDYADIKGGIPSHFPMVFLDRKPRNCPCDTIVISNYNAVYKGTEDLIRRGNRRIGCITGTLNISTLNEREQAFRDCLGDNHIEVDERAILRLDLTKKDFTPDFAEYFRNDVTAVVYLNNTITIDAFGYLTNNPIVPNRFIDSVGYSEEGWHNYVLKYMDIITQPVADMGNSAGSRILERIADPNMPAGEIVLNADCVPRTVNLSI